MGIYYGKRENPCPRCGSVVLTTFISVGEMNFSQYCTKCQTTDFSEEEEKLLGKNLGDYDEGFHNIVVYNFKK